MKIIRASLQGASITTQTVDAQAFIDIVGEMINHNPDSLYPKRRQLDPYSDLNYQCVEDSFDLKVRADYLTLGLRENGRNSTARILNFHLARNPEIAFLWNVADNYSNLLNPELSISCPFILTLTLVVEDQVKTHSEANLKYMDLEKKSKTSYAKWFPSVEKEAKEWGELRQRLGSGQSSVVSYFLNITAFCKDNNETALEVEQDILNSFRKNGFELISPRFNHMRNFLTCLPFMAGKGLFKQLKEAGVVQRAESFNVANLMPLVADNRLWGWAVIAQFAYYLAGFPWYEGNILFAFAVAAQVLTWCETRTWWRSAETMLLLAMWLPFSGTSYGIAGLLMLAVSHRLYRAEDRMERLALVACLLAVIPALNLATSDAAAVAGLVMTVLTVGLVSCTGKSLPRFWYGDFFPTFYACHLTVLGVLAV